MSNQEISNNVDDPTGSASIDTALLESLFYNEMMLIDDTSSLLSSSLFSSLSAEFASSSSSSGHPSRQPNAANRGRASLSQLDPSTIAEKALLRHFGVSGEIPPDDNLDAAAAAPAAPPVLEGRLEPTQLLTHNVVQDPSWGASKHSSGGGGAVNYDPNLDNSYASKPAATTTYHPPIPLEPVANAAPLPQYPPLTAGAVRSTTAAAAAVGAAGAAAAAVPHEKLVSQFATLANRLGIRVPPHLLQSLLNNEDDGRTADAVTAFANAASAYAGSDFGPVMAATAASSLAAATPPAAVQELENVAKAAIAAVSETRKRPSFDEGRPPAPFATTTTAAASADTNAGVAGASGTASSSKAPTYSKRRKKPRLADCESKLAQLQAENDLLKRHLTTISNQSHKIDSERKELEKKMRTMLETGATPQEMDQLVQTFSDYYSDYGRRRHQELEFHLEQLQRLANPTNFTKMGLWTLGQQSSNPRKDPIASILQKELGITPQQGKKIIEQRQKIRDVCTNLSEVRIIAKERQASRKPGARRCISTPSSFNFSVPHPAEQAQGPVRAKDPDLQRPDGEVPRDPVPPPGHQASDLDRRAHVGPRQGLPRVGVGADPDQAQEGVRRGRLSLPTSCLLCQAQPALYAPRKTAELFIRGVERLSLFTRANRTGPRNDARVARKRSGETRCSGSNCTILKHG
jgi:hypothetical protein